MPMAVETVDARVCRIRLSCRFQLQRGVTAIVLQFAAPLPASSSSLEPRGGPSPNRSICS